MSWIKTDERGCITEVSDACREGMTWTDTDMRGWMILDSGVPMYRLTGSGRVARRTDQEIKRDKLNK